MPYCSEADPRDLRVTFAQAEAPPTSEVQWAQCRPPFHAYSVSSEGETPNGKGQTIKPAKPADDGYLFVVLLTKDGRRTLHVHRAVADAFLDDERFPGATEIDHIDQNRHNNSVEDLKWATHSQNLANRQLDVRPAVRSSSGVVFSPQLRVASASASRGSARLAYDLKLCVRSGGGGAGPGGGGLLRHWRGAAHL